MTVRVYLSSDTSAPALRGNTAGDLINLLSKCLVEGYGSKTAAGWTKPFTGTNVAAFKQGSGSRGMYLRVDDTMVLTAQGTRYARVVGYENMSDVNTGSPVAFPTETQISGGLYWFTMYNSSAAWTGRDTARPWMLIADESFFYLYIGSTLSSSDTTTGYKELFWFGDFKSRKTNDAFNTCIRGGATASAINAATGTSPYVEGGSVSATSTGFYIARANDQITGPIQGSYHGDYNKQGATNTLGGSASGVSYPNSADNALYLSPAWTVDPGSGGSGVLRGVLPGFWAPAHTNLSTINSLDTFTGQGDMEGKTFVAVRIYNNTCFLETSDTWR
jgi:hypothetical protein